MSMAKLYLMLATMRLVMRFCVAFPMPMQKGSVTRHLRRICGLASRTSRQSVSTPTIYSHVSRCTPTSTPVM
ncbi:hypothetical protein PF010_g21261 [Phytophthora fragariae]|uniref:Secreted protein n=1 Tax=Phytophthora fragariae TaxID=53985 RepID=A0A6A3QSI6_9STRA|nr:hypothetical protein PF003_g38664 [Phytophthora fragariae]KAE8916874.1 hypothetical protein PF009_g32803 [Phytophthora fragariae]KAE9080862.1 hypothetical protein PF007_g22875 [Phytophthora fragariae]KAE9083327.1 hypothetical protein PF010_g21261 [Phytophthora fragariae]KAE9097790.1 hypothetical protein PF006_g23499 [Phytophthora fragariae]